MSPPRPYLIRLLLIFLLQRESLVGWPGLRGPRARPSASPENLFCLGHGFFQAFAMAMHFREGYRLLQKYERRRGAAYDVVVKVRPDLIYMAPFPSIAAVAAPRAVAHGVMTRTGRFQPVWK